MAAPSTSKLLFRKGIRDALQSIKQLIAVFAMGTIAMTLFVGLMANAESLSSRVNSLFAQGDTADVWVVTKDYKAEDEENIKSLLGEGDVLDERFMAPGKIGSHAASVLICPSMPTLSRPVEMFEVQEEQTEDHFFIVDRDVTTAGGVTLGAASDPGMEETISFDFSSLLVGYEEMIEQLDSVFIGDDNFIASGSFSFKTKVTSSMVYGENIQKSSFSSSCALLSHDIFEEAFQAKLKANYSPLGVAAINVLLGKGFPKTNEYLIKLQDTATREAKENAIRDYFFAKGEDNNLIEILNRSSSPWSIAASTEVQEAQQLSFVFPLVFFLVALLLILTTVSQMVLKQRTLIGTMKALGVRRHSIYMHYLNLIIVIVLASSIVGSVIGTILIPAIMAAKYDIFYTLPARGFFVFPVVPALASIAVFLGVAMLVTFLAIRKEVSITPAQSMRPAPVKMKHSSLMRAKKPLGLSFSMAIRNVRIAWGKSLMAIFGVAGCTALLLCGFGVQDTIDRGIALDMNLAYSSSLTLTYSAPKTDARPSYFDHEDVLDYNQFYQTSTTAKFGGKSFLTQLHLFEDEHPYVKIDIPKGKVAVSLKIQTELGVHEGDVIEFSHKGVYLSATVGKVYEAFSFNGVKGLFSDFEDSIQRAYTHAHVMAKPDADVPALSKYFVENGYASSAQTTTELSAKVSDIVGGVSTMTNAIKIFAILLAAVALYNLVLMNFRSHARDVATLKVLGFSLPEIALSLVAESIILTTLGIGIGFALGFPFLYGVLVVNTVSLIQFLYFIAPLTYLISFGLTFGVSFLVNLYLSFLLKKVKMVESLKSVE